LTSHGYNRMVVSMTTVLHADNVFAALADATRRDIVLRAIGGHEGIVELAGHYPMSFAAVQKHVAVLEGARLVTKRRQGREQLVSGNVEMLRTASLLLDQAAAVWQSRVDRMSELLADESSG